MNNTEQPSEQPKRKGHGPAKGTKFDKLRKLAKIPLRFKESARGDSKEDGTTIEFYKRSRIHKDGTWVCQEALKIYQKMIELQKERDPDQKDEAIAEEIFTEVLGCKSGYVRGMGKSMIPPLVSESRSEKVAQMSN
ncbi:hypothetical protein CJ030_MR2G012412 [Morella rubra]|uniref:Uncharacterized protein n=1 Tax=Morella rubra TaxID=262757 RepID=A0A6A1WDT4_9ROSI|nr:hypothetical protein CJ030_MR2G012412 [Morella rubra]